MESRLIARENVAIHLHATKLRIFRVLKEKAFSLYPSQRMLWHPRINRILRRSKLISPPLSIVAYSSSESPLILLFKTYPSNAHSSAPAGPGGEREGRSPREESGGGACRRRGRRIPRGESGRHKMTDGALTVRPRDVGDGIAAHGTAERELRSGGGRNWSRGTHHRGTWNTGGGRVSTGDVPRGEAREHSQLNSRQLCLTGSCSKLCSREV